MRPNKTPISKVVVYRGMINDVTLWPADGNSYRDLMLIYENPVW